MTSNQHDLEPEAPAVRLQYMNFQPVEEDDRKAVYRAFIEDDDAPGAPVYALTVTVASPGDREAEELERFLNDMEAGFVLTAPNPEEDTGDDREPLPDLDLDKEILIEPQLVRLRTLDGTFGVTVVVRTAVAEGEDPRAAEFRSALEYQPVVAELYVRKTVLAGKDHRYRAIGGVIRTATATARYGTGTIRQPAQYIRVGGGSRSARGTTVAVHGVTRCTYDFVGYFNGPF
jgi:hypothetical protein